MKLTYGLIKADIIAALQAITYYETENVRDIKNVAAYHIQQATEKLIKIQIYSCGKEINNKKMYTHDIEALIAYAESLEFGVIIPKYIKDNSLIITDWEAGSRYDVGFSIRIDTLKRAYDELNNWYIIVNK